MYPYERFDKTLSESITNSKHPELNAVKKMEMQWLLTMLESSGFLEPLGSRPVPRKLENLQYLHAGQYKPKHRQADQQEQEALLQVLKTSALANTDITTFHYAKRTIGSSEVLYRDSFVEQPN
ncbi:uncharacterized protein [Argopecten irradians]|uniref:uncharacterized protein n=1 Tax=Argopecten irradians TaxID=31199 RepID=UPI0037163303